MGYTLYQGDCLDVLPTLAAGSVDAVITDPPYLLTDSNVTIKGKGVSHPVQESKAVGMPWGYSTAWIDAVARLQPKHWVVYCNERMLAGVLAGLERHTVLGTVFVWRKPNAPPMIRNVPRLDCEFVIWAKHPKANNVRAREFPSLVLNVPLCQAGCFADERILQPRSGKALHPTQKPLAVVRPFVQRLTEWGWTILDPFMGTGTTGEAARTEGRNFIGIELDARYYRIAERRIANAQPPLFVADAPAVPEPEQAAMFSQEAHP